MDTDNVSLVRNNDDVNRACDMIDRMANNDAHSEKDTPLCLTIDELNEFGFATTHSRDTFSNDMQDFTTDKLSRHVMFNQVGLCTTRWFQNISLTSRQNLTVQSSCATISGQ